MVAQAQSFWFLNTIKPLVPVAVLEPHYPVRRYANAQSTNWAYDRYWDDDMGEAYGDPVTVYVEDRISQHIWDLIQGGADVIRVTLYVGVDKKSGKRWKKTFYALDNYINYKIGQTIKSVKAELED